VEVLNLLRREDGSLEEVEVCLVDVSGCGVVLDTLCFKLGGARFDFVSHDGTATFYLSCIFLGVGVEMQDGSHVLVSLIGV